MTLGSALESWVIGLIFEVNGPHWPFSCEYIINAIHCWQLNGPHWIDFYFILLNVVIKLWSNYDFFFGKNVIYVWVSKIWVLEFEIFFFSPKKVVLTSLVSLFFLFFLFFACLSFPSHFY